MFHTNPCVVLQLPSSSEGSCEDALAPVGLLKSHSGNKSSAVVVEEVSIGIRDVESVTLKIAFVGRVGG